MSATGRILIRAGLDQNPMRRPTDRIESWTSLLLLAVFLVVGPTVTWYAGQTTYRAGLRTERTERAARQLVVATLIQPASIRIDAASTFPSGTAAEARWVTPGAASRTGVIDVPAGLQAGAAVRIWTDPAGNVTVRPRRHSETVSDAALVATMTALTLLGLLAAIGMRLRHRLDQRRFDEWDLEWQQFYLEL